MDDELEAQVVKLAEAGESDETIAEFIKLYRERQGNTEKAVPYQSEALASGMHRSPGAVTAGLMTAAAPFSGPVGGAVGRVLSHPITESIVGGYGGYKTGGIPGALLGAAGFGTAAMGLRSLKALAAAHKAAEAARVGAGALRTVDTVGDVATSARKFVLTPEEIKQLEVLKKIASEQGIRTAAEGAKGFIR